MIAASGQRIRYKLTARDNVKIPTVCRKWPGRFWVTKENLCRLTIFGKLSVSLAEVTPFHLESLPWRIFYMHDIFLVSPINHTIDCDAILCHYAPLSSCKIWTFYIYQQYTCIICSFRKYYWIMTSGHLNAKNWVLLVDDRDPMIQWYKNN